MAIRVTSLVTICVIAHVLVSAEDAEKQPKVNPRQHIQHIPSQKEAQLLKQSLQVNQTTTQESKHAEETQSTQLRKTRSSKVIHPKRLALQCESEGFIADPYNCSVFHLCVKKPEIPLDIQNLSAAYIKISIECSTGFLYDSKINTCLNISDPSRAIVCSNQSSVHVEHFTFRRNNTNEVSTQSPSGHPEVKYVTDENDHKESGNGQNNVTTSNKPSSIKPQLSKEYLEPLVVVPEGGNPFVYVVPRKNPTNDSNNELEPGKKSGKSVSLPSSQTMEDVNENRTLSSNNIGQNLTSFEESTSPSADSENKRQQSSYNGNGSSTKAIVIYTIPPFNALQNSTLLPPQSNTSSPNPQSLAAGRQSNGSVSPLSDHTTGKIDGVLDEENEQPRIHLPGPTDTPQGYSQPPWPEIPEDVIDFKETENVGLTEFNQIWQSSRNTSKTKSTSQPPKKPSIHQPPPQPQSPKNIRNINKVENNDDIGIKNETFRLSTSTTPKNVRNTNCRAYASTVKHPLAMFYCTIDQLTNISFNSASELRQQQPSYDPRPGSMSVLPQQSAKSIPERSDTATTPRPTDPAPKFSYSRPHERNDSIPNTSPPTSPSLPPQQSVKSIPERSDTETTPRPPDPVPKFSYPRPHERNDSIPNTSPPTSPSVLPQQSVKSIPERSDTETYPRRPDPSPKFSYPRPHERNDNKPNTSPPTRTQFVRNVQTSTSTSLYRSSSSKEPPRKQQETKKGNKIICTPEGFFAIENDCEHFYRCTSIGEFLFSCSPGTVWDQDIKTCNHRWATSRHDC